MFQTTGLLLSIGQALLFQTIVLGRQIHGLGGRDHQEDQAEKKRTPPSLAITKIHVSSSYPYLAKLAAESKIIIFTSIVPMLVWFVLNILLSRIAPESCKFS